MHLQTSMPSSSCRVTSGTEVQGLLGLFSARGEISCILVPSTFTKNLCTVTGSGILMKLGRARGLLDLKRGLLVKVKFNTNGSFPAPSSAPAVHDHQIALPPRVYCANPRGQAVAVALGLGVSGTHDGAQLSF